MTQENMELIIDDEDTYLELDNVFYVHPSRIGSLKHLSHYQFISATIKNCPIENLTGYNMVQMFGTMKVGAVVEITIFQPLTVLQMFDAKTIEANAIFAGFDNVKISETTYIDDKTQKSQETLQVTFIKPASKGLTQQEIMSIKEDVRTRTLTRKTKQNTLTRRRTRKGLNENK